MTARHGRLVIRILAFSDLHRDAEAARRIVAASGDADVLVGAGDFATGGVGASEALSVLREAGVPLVVVAGNHDNSAELRSLCKDWAHLLEGSTVMLDGIKFFGLGGEIPQRHDADWNESFSEAEAGQMLSKCPERAVLVTHTPPFGCADLQRDGSHEGSEAIRDAIRQTNPLLCLCGHIHNAWGMSGRIGETPVHNLGPTVNWFDL